jgi:hypothetical protein
MSYIGSIPYPLCCRIVHRLRSAGSAGGKGERKRVLCGRTSRYRRVNAPDAEAAIEAKDLLENKLHTDVCSGDVGLKEAQQAISTNWVDAYRRFIGEPPH